MTEITPDKRWARNAVIYQIYPRSFFDSDADGVGDLPGITSKLDYLKDLGVDGIWLSPFYPSPMADFGYDISDYLSVDPIFGTLHDFDTLLHESHERGLKVIIDLVPNHTSDEHAWFVESASSHDNPKADWYIWRDPAGTDDKGNPLPPNNWIDVFAGESAWEYVESRKQFYLHSFHRKQPDLNWINPIVRDAIKHTIRYWLDRGVDGFRVDAINFVAKEPSLPDDPINPEYHPGPWPKYGALSHRYSQGTDLIYPYLQEITRVLHEDMYVDRAPFMVFEVYPQTDDHIASYASYYRNIDPSVSAPFNFEGMSLPWTAESWRWFLVTFLHALHDIHPSPILNTAFGNHDNPRIASRFGDDRARAMAVLVMTLPGSAYVYNGEELGMLNGEIPRDRIVDPGAVSEEGGRDPERTPLQWTSGPNAGFTTADDAWLPIASSYKERNVETESRDPSSFLMLYRALIGFKHGISDEAQFEIIEDNNPDVLSYRIDGNLVCINFTDKSVSVPVDSSVYLMFISSQFNLDSATELSPFEARIYKPRSA